MQVVHDPRQDDRQREEQHRGQNLLGACFEIQTTMVRFWERNEYGAADIHKLFDRLEALIEQARSGDDE